MNIREFIQYTKDHEDEWRNYCEILLDRYGNVYLARPCHQVAAIELGSSYTDQTVEEYKKSIPLECSIIHWIVSKENIVAVWYSQLIVSKNLNRWQKRVISLLKDRGLIYHNCDTETTIEYEHYLERKKLNNREITIDDFIAALERLRTL